MAGWRQLAASLVNDRALRARALAFAGAAFVALALGYVLPNPALAALAFRRCGYFILAAAFGGFGWVMFQLLRARLRFPAASAWRRAVPIVLALGALLWLALVSEPAGYKVTNDEFVLQATALDLHLRREPAVLVRAYDIEGAFTPLLAYTDKRPFFFPFVLTLVHDLTGYREANAFLLNAALAAASLALVFVLARRLAGNSAAALAAVVLWGGLPLFVQNATGSGMELLNVVMLAVVMLLAWEYLAAPDERRASALVLASVLLAQTRYESAVFIPLAGVVLLAGWRVAQRPILPWSAVAAPLLMLPYAWQNHFTNANRALWELHASQESRFDVGYLARNLQEAGRFFFTWQDRMLANSWLLSVAGASALLAAAAWALRRWRAWRIDQPGCVVALYALGVLANLGLLMFYYWGQLTDPVAERLSLPSLMIAALALAWALGRIVARGFDARWAVGAAAIYVVGVMRPQIANHYYTQFNPAPHEVAWEENFLRQRPPMERLIITNKTVLPWIIDLQPAVMLKYMPGEREQLRFHLGAGTFGEIIVTQKLIPSTRDGDYVVDPADALPRDFKLEVLAERRFNAMIDRISRLVAVGDDPPAGNKTAAVAPAPRSAAVVALHQPHEIAQAAVDGIAQLRGRHAVDQD